MKLAHHSQPFDPLPAFLKLWTREYRRVFFWSRVFRIAEKVAAALFFAALGVLGAWLLVNLL